MPRRTKPRKKVDGLRSRANYKSGATGDKPTQQSACPVVGVGGSAGGFEAAMELLRHLPARNGMAFVIVQHLDPHHTSRLANLLGKVTPMPVIEVNEQLTPQSNTVYVQPPNKCVVMKNGALTLIRRTERLNLAIDHFFESLADELGSRAIGVVLSGTGSDGTAGLRAIKAAGGLTFAQDEESAKFNAMPRSAIRSGFVDAVLPPDRIAAEIARIAKHPYVSPAVDNGATEAAEEAAYREGDNLDRVFLSLKKQMGVDFTTYKPSTLKRRIQRRMALHRMRDLAEYVRFLRGNKKENEALFDDLLINVTRFFRDQAVFRALQKRFLPAILKNKDRKSALRVWVPGCATGEEVYSLAICILETLGKRAFQIPVQIFGTDLSESTIDHARAGIYSSAIEKDVSRARLRRFFIKRDSTYQIDQRVREMCTFARQNVTTDPPFSRLDLISCRNVLIYLGAELHKRCIPQFHHALNPDGFLILGPAESVGVYDQLFRLVDKKNKIYAKKIVANPHEVDFALYQGPQFPHHRMPALPNEVSGFTNQLLGAADRIMLTAYAPAAVVVDQDMQVYQFRGQTEPYLQHKPGPATLNLLQMVQPSLVADLRTTVRRANLTKKPTRKERALVKTDGSAREVNIQVVPFKVPGAPGKSWLLVIFDETTRGKQLGKTPRAFGRTASQRELAELRRELTASKEALQTIIEEQEATNEELKAANEEVESSNEELQSTNEELETAKEELQSTNEELTTLNEELSNRNLETMQMNSDLTNLLASIQLPIVMVDNTLTVRRATPAARDVFNVRDTDIGRPLRELKPNIDIPDLEKILRQVIETLAARERNIRDKQGRAYSLRIRPYRTTDNKIDGAVLTLVDIENKADGRASKTKTK
jgi:two-component system, chemotaxis family, CheB/CheR fusion protein